MKSYPFPTQSFPKRYVAPFGEGHHPNNCLELDRVLTTSNKRDTLSLLPILKVRPGVCLEKRTRFEYEYDVPFNEQMAKGVLLHVRVMDGRSVNHLFQNKWVDKVLELGRR